MGFDISEVSLLCPEGKGLLDLRMHKDCTSSVKAEEIHHCRLDG